MDWPTPTWDSGDGRVRLYRADALEVLPTLPGVNAIITDPPFSARTHRGHDASAGGHKENRAVVRKSRNGKVYQPNKDAALRKPLGYEAWEEADVIRFVNAAAAVCSGWLICMTDHVLAPVYCRAMESTGRYVFAPLPYYAPGRTVRLSGDGPSSWTDWIIASRTAAQHRWGTLPGGYVKRAEYGEHEHMGGKPVGLMAELIRHYSRDGDTVCDPCLGSGTTGVAALRQGRPFVGIEINEDYFDRSVGRIEKALNEPDLFKETVPQETADLFE